jgi:type IV pilus assembly protein PilE
MHSTAKRATGFTLIELMIVVVIIAILTGIAVPSYRQYVIRSNRSAAQSVMLDIANREQQYLLANRAYASEVTLAANGYVLPPEVSTNYSFTVDIEPEEGVSGPPTYLITFTPLSTSGQATDGWISLDSAGNKEPAVKWKR